MTINQWSLLSLSTMCRIDHWALKRWNIQKQSVVGTPSVSPTHCKNMSHCFFPRRLFSHLLGNCPTGTGKTTSIKQPITDRRRKARTSVLTRSFTERPGIPNVCKAVPLHCSSGVRDMWHAAMARPDKLRSVVVATTVVRCGPQILLLAAPLMLWTQMCCCMPTPVLHGFTLQKLEAASFAEKDQPTSVAAELVLL